MSFDMKRYCILLLVGLLSCESHLEIVLPEAEDALILNAQLKTSSAFQQAYLDHSSSVRGITDASGARFRMWNLDRKATELEATADVGGIVVFSLPALQPGERLRLEAEYAGEKVWSEVTVPQPVQILQVDSSRVQVAGFAGMVREFLQFRVRFKDPEGRQYYRFEMRDIRDPLQPEMIPLDASSDPVLSGVSGSVMDSFFTARNAYLVFSDEAFDGQERTFLLNLPIGETNWDGYDVRIYLQSIGFEEYHYLQSLNNMETFGYEEVIMIEPTTLPSNVHGGLGFVGMLTESGSKEHFVLPVTGRANEPEP